MRKTSLKKTHLGKMDMSHAQARSQTHTDLPRALFSREKERRIDREMKSFSF